MTTYSKRLDRSRPFGEHRPPENGCFYNQGGYDFDHEGNLVDTKLSDEQKKALTKPVKATVKAPAQPKQSGDDNSGKEDGGESGGEGGNAETDGLNLEAWLRGEEDYPFPSVQQAVKTRYSVWKTARRDLVLFLVEDQKLVEPANLSDEFKALVA